MSTTRNPLLSEAPEQYHKLSNTGQFRRLMGRAPVASDYHGVHTTDSASIAAAYAISAWTLRGERADDFPVVIRLRTDGLEPLADVDAMIQGLGIYDANRITIATMLRDGDSVEDIERDFDGFEMESDLLDLVGCDPAAVVFDEVSMHPPNIVAALIKYGGADAVTRFVAGAAPPDRALSEVVRQRRYLSDFDLDRVVGIDAVKPWWGEIVNEDEEDALAQIEAAGWNAVTFDDAASCGIRPELRCIYGAPHGGGHDYHGTTAGVVRAAFPGIVLDPGFPPVTPRADVDVTARGEDVDDEDEDS